ncbi:hypothetical protein Kpol_1060p20 [Vanderwaltozyma polyspora DSM 70294]|uniref:Uncharacterized protein n=1 Tax=Vanderwaltozyma polyspora (strain ATCC 22028 / DSM 70294 / BCRC 21397 / CBS 2163 / NBRC 10782 / NRRL Y-8283 / UCD 57-17) TaxID=436907 RepID=A7TK18_VANPO|nr:uncharacterized protein Kpol_1060p20 [Vanderwaltozyma polyspora DSM 70294]EDO17364.1 hypothetical protein Kpol_1060p20 [Vanderwaltozyma polyspora DSM 70294]
MSRLEKPNDDDLFYFSVTNDVYLEELPDCIISPLLKHPNMLQNTKPNYTANASASASAGAGASDSGDKNNETQATKGVNNIVTPVSKINDEIFELEHDLELPMMVMKSDYNYNYTYSSYNDKSSVVPRYELGLHDSIDTSEYINSAQRNYRVWLSKV